MSIYTNKYEIEELRRLFADLKSSFPSVGDDALCKKATMDKESGRWLETLTKAEVGIDEGSYKRRNGNYCGVSLRRRIALKSLQRFGKQCDGLPS